MHYKKLNKMSDIEFNEILLHNADYLKPFAFTLTRDNEKAKDLVQETMFRALANKDKYHVGTNIKAWIYTIMRNIFINDYRKKSRQQVISDNTENDYFINSGQLAIQNSAERNLQMKDIMAQVNKLPEIFKQPFVMYYEGYKYNEIADVLTVPLGTIKSRIHFSRKILREQLAHVA